MAKVSKINKEKETEDSLDSEFYFWKHKVYLFLVCVLQVGVLKFGFKILEFGYRYQLA